MNREQYYKILENVDRWARWWRWYNENLASLIKLEKISGEQVIENFRGWNNMDGIGGAYWGPDIVIRERSDFFMYSFKNIISDYDIQECIRGFGCNIIDSEGRTGKIVGYLSDMTDSYFLVCDTSGNEFTVLLNSRYEIKI